MSRERLNIDRIPIVILMIALAAVVFLNYILQWGLNWIDYTIIGVIFISAFVGYVRGLIKAVFSLAGYIAAVVCSALFSEPVALFIMEKTNIRETIVKTLEEAYSGFTVPAFRQSVDFSVIENSNQLFEKYPVLKEFLNDNTILGQLFDMANPLEAGANVLSDAVASLADLLVFSVLKVISIIIVFFLVKLIVSIIGGIINSLISHSGILSTTNKTVGMILGMVIGCVIVYVAMFYVIPFLGSLNIIAIPKEYGESVILGLIFAKKSL
ncbi:hypothetical protein CSTERTH_05700 [Thermoclostridium stercorarium subsp. thermolacticum DSM 2910]|jgi:uncharacterized membrane protein required for colicin V production|uniref:Colicin V production protein n=2 Tax=Thermoclostridium stercorarium TaxID=1510 RepID=A0A1B1YCS9_THEST|nr:CvpA family protein [Thermoclostridium stercorarium]ANW98566.1 hypothetical protein CSTERTH_05700 [Thermoclostridium stercorarium subsp. thermolacticum DSM 2910]UZQ86721.1 CvpA family protein [Thermoclostridium stercorarium]